MHNASFKADINASVEPTSDTQSVTLYLPLSATVDHEEQQDTLDLAVVNFDQKSYDALAKMKMAAGLIDGIISCDTPRFEVASNRPGHDCTHISEAEICINAAGNLHIRCMDDEFEIPHASPINFSLAALGNALQMTRHDNVGNTVLIAASSSMSILVKDPHTPVVKDNVLACLTNHTWDEFYGELSAQLQRTPGINVIAHIGSSVQ